MQPSQKVNNMARSSGSFKPGQSGNPAGKSPGQTPRALFRKLVGDNLQVIVETLVNNAKAGDTAAAKVLTDRLVPALKPTSDSMSLKVSGTLSEQGAAIVAAMTTGKVTPEQAKSAMDVILAQSHLIDQAEIIAQLNEFSTWLQNSKK